MGRFDRHLLALVLVKIKTIAVSPKGVLSLGPGLICLVRFMSIYGCRGEHGSFFLVPISVTIIKPYSVRSLTFPQTVTAAPGLTQYSSQSPFAFKT
jgi:hypothetical protein